MRLEGSLDAFSLPDIFSLLSMTKKTGGLHLRSTAAEGVVWLRDGQITGGAADLSHNALAIRLAGNQSVSEESLEAAVTAMTEGGEVGIARALLDESAIDEAELHGVVGDHLVDVVFDLLRWTEGSFEFVVDEANVDDVGVNRAVDEVVNDAKQRLESWESIAERVPGGDAVMGVVVSPEGDPHLNREEWALVALVDGKRSVADLVAVSGRSEFAVYGALAELVGRGLLHVPDATEESAVSRRLSVLSRLTPVDDAPDLATASEPAADEAADLSEDESDLSIDAGVEEAAAAVDAPDVDNVTEAEADDDAAAVADVEDEADDADVADSGREDSVNPDAASADVDAEEDHDGDESHDAAADVTGDVDDDADDDDADDDEAPVATVTRIPGQGQGRDLSKVTPQRPEPFLPTRQPDHPEPVAAVAGGGAVPAPSNAIERDPSVNKSLLLRLIAGVRGL